MCDEYAIDIEVYAHVSRTVGNVRVAVLDQSTPEYIYESTLCKQPLVKGLKNSVAQAHSVKCNVIQRYFLRRNDFAYEIPKAAAIGGDRS